MDRKSRQQQLDDNAQLSAETPSNPGLQQSKSNTRGPSSMCERCKENVTPVKDTLPDTKTHIVAVVLFLIGLPFLIFLPYCCDCFGKPVSRCPNCGCFIDTPAENGNK